MEDFAAMNDAMDMDGFAAQQDPMDDFAAQQEPMDMDGFAAQLPQQDPLDMDGFAAQQDPMDMDGFAARKYEDKTAPYHSFDPYDVEDSSRTITVTGKGLVILALICINVITMTVVWFTCTKSSHAGKYQAVHFGMDSDLEQSRV